jgi:hypothetical protein
LGGAPSSLPGSGGLDFGAFLIFTPEPVGVPEPSSLTLLALGALDLAGGYSWRLARSQRQEREVGRRERHLAARKPCG